MEGEVEQNPHLLMPHLMYFPPSHRGPWDGGVFLAAFYKWENWAPEKWDVLSKITSAIITIITIIIIIHSSYNNNSNDNNKSNNSRGPCVTQASLVAQMVKNLLQSRRPRFSPLVGKIPWWREWLPTCIIAWRIPRTEETGRLQSIGSQRVEHDWSNLAHTHIWIWREFNSAHNMFQRNAILWSYHNNNIIPFHLP